MTEKCYNDKIDLDWDIKEVNFKTEKAKESPKEGINEIKEEDNKINNNDIKEENNILNVDIESDENEKKEKSKKK